MPVKHVVHVHDMRPWLASPHLRHRIRRTVYRFFLDRSDVRFVACVEAVEEYARRHFLRPRHRAATIHSGIDLGRFRPAPEADGTTRPASSVMLGTAGVFQPLKGHDYLLRALADVRAKGLDVRLRIAGGGSRADDFKRLAERLGVVSATEFLGRVQNMVAFYCTIDIYVLPSLSEGLPLSILEAMAMAKPVISTRTGGIPFEVREGEDGLLVPTADAAALGAAIERLAMDPAARARMGRSGKDRVESGFRIEQFAACMAAYYHEMLNER
jgi:L-malate glycosyltransferase